MNDPALHAWRRSPAHTPTLFLHSARSHPRYASHSYIAQPKTWFKYDQNQRAHLSGIDLPLTHHLWTDLRNLLNHPHLSGKWFGYFSYDLFKTIEKNAFKNHPTHSDRDWPLVWLGHDPNPQIIPTPDPQATTSCHDTTLSDTPARLQQHHHTNSALPFQAEKPFSVFSQKNYVRAVQKVKNYIADGDIFQANLAQRFTASYTGAPRNLYEKLNAVSPAWYGGIMEFPSQTAAGESTPGHTLVSTSPELFLQVNGDQVITRPIKGTRPANVPADELRDSEKDQAELNMIVDLMRNDIGRVCAYGSVRVPEPRVIETHPTIHHGVSTVTGTLANGKDIVDLLKATLPGGSVTGAPKIRAMQIINELEPVARGPYCGAMGYVSKDETQLNITIRTLSLDNRGHCDFSVGGGIVADSDPQAEYQETLDKAAAMMRALR